MHTPSMINITMIKGINISITSKVSLCPLCGLMATQIWLIIILMIDFFLSAINLKVVKTRLRIILKNFHVQKNDKPSHNKIYATCWFSIIVFKIHIFTRYSYEKKFQQRYNMTCIILIVNIVLNFICWGNETNIQYLLHARHYTSTRR